jgi:hypothetical protein
LRIGLERLASLRRFDPNDLPKAHIGNASAPCTDRLDLTKKLRTVSSAILIRRGSVALPDENGVAFSEHLDGAIAVVVVPTGDDVLCPDAREFAGGGQGEQDASP